MITDHRLAARLRVLRSEDADFRAMLNLAAARLEVLADKIFSLKAEIEGHVQ